MRAVDARVAHWRGVVAARLAEVPGVTVDEGEDGIVVRGRRLRARWLNDARLRWLGGWM